MPKRKEISRWQREKIRIAMEAMLPHLKACIASSPALERDEKTLLYQRFLDAFAGLDAAANAERSQHG